MGVLFTCDLEVQNIMDHILRRFNFRTEANVDTKNIVIAVIMGIAAGWLASWIVGGSGIVQYLISGVLGSFVGSFVLNKGGINLGIKNEIGRDVATATVGAIIVMIIARILH
jgi:uncharacterized membrane protein YeaQ/YmgE (transglycosylase-associated protein family)